jgi:glycosyltransferase involved in cell wall biosynthesis
VTEVKLLSVVVPIYFEESLLDEFYSRLKHVLDGLRPTLDHEIVFVNDGSTDRSLEMLLSFAESDPSVRVIDLSRNFGHQIAITAGIDAAVGHAVVVIDGDLQDPPEVIAQMVEMWRDGHHVVYGTRARREGESILKLATAKAFYRVLNLLSDTRLPLDTGDFRLMDRVVVDALKEMREETRYIRGMVVWVGFRQIALPYRRDARYAGATKYTLRKVIRLAVHGITSFSSKPLLLSAQFGSVVTFASFLYAAWLVFEKVMRPETSIAGWTSVLVAILFMGGVQLMSIGVLGAYLGRVFAETKRRPLYVVAGRYGGRCADTVGEPRGSRE